MDFVVSSIYRKPSPALRNDTPLAPNFRPSRPLRAQLSPPQLSSQTGSDSENDPYELVVAWWTVRLAFLVLRICVRQGGAWGRPAPDCALVLGVVTPRSVGVRSPRRVGRLGRVSTVVGLNVCDVGPTVAGCPSPRSLANPCWMLRPNMTGWGRKCSWRATGSGRPAPICWTTTVEATTRKRSW